MAEKSKEVTILFADVCKSAQVYKVLGDQKAQQVIGGMMNCLAEITRQNNGEVIKSIGDAVMSIFPSVENAVEASRFMQATISQQFSDVDGPIPLNIHIGFHYGSVVCNGDDVFGNAVIIASKLADHAKPRQIITTKSTMERAPESITPLLRYVSKVSVKNISEEIIAYELIWDKKEITAKIDHHQCVNRFHTKLDLLIGNQRLVLDKSRSSLTIGRMDYNDIVIDLSWVSRSHVSIEFRDGIFMMTDKSSNGTYIYPDKKEMKFIQQSEHPLSGTGSIFLGIDKNADRDNEKIQYSVT